jgi:hypothetical protein
LYSRILPLSQKRYMYRKCGNHGNLVTKTGNLSVPRQNRVILNMEKH